MPDNVTADLIAEVQTYNVTARDFGFHRLIGDAEHSLDVQVLLNRLEEHRPALNIDRGRIPRALEVHRVVWLPESDTEIASCIGQDYEWEQRPDWGQVVVVRDVPDKTIVVGNWAFAKRS